MNSSMRIATYSRFSSDNQRPASIVDQQRVCREHVSKREWQLAREFDDAAMSGASLNRPGIRALLAFALQGGCDAVLAESLDRFSRDQEDIAAIFKRLKYHGVKMITISEGEITTLHVGLRGTMNAMYLDDLADKTRRGLRGVVAEGRSAGGRSYGYREDSTAAPGTLVIVPREAEIVQRVFNDYAVGLSPRRIAMRLNAQRVPSPSGGTWTPSTIHGNRQRGTGLLNNELYIGRRVWNKLSYVRNPDTGKRQSRLNPVDARVVEDVPALRIIGAELWEAVKNRQHTTRPTRSRLVDARRPKYLLTGLLRCAQCGANFTLASHDRLMCANSRNRGTCSNRKVLKRELVEQRVITALRNGFLKPDAYAAFRRGFESELEEIARAVRMNERALVRERATLEQRISNIVAAIGSGLMSDALRSELSRCETESAALAARLNWKRPPPPPPDLPESFRRQVDRLVQDLGGDGGDEARCRIREHIDKVIVAPDGDGLRLVGNAATLFTTELGTIVGCGGGI